MQAHVLAEPGLTAAQAWKQEFFASFFRKRRPFLLCSCQPQHGWSEAENPPGNKRRKQLV